MSPSGRTTEFRNAISLATQRGDEANTASAKARGLTLGGSTTAYASA